MGRLTRHQRVPGDSRQRKRVEFSEFNERRTNPDPPQSPHPPAPGPARSPRGRRSAMP